MNLKKTSNLDKLGIRQLKSAQLLDLPDFRHGFSALSTILTTILRFFYAYLEYLTLGNAASCKHAP